MRIALLSQSFNKGMGQARVNYELCRGLLSEGFQLEVFSSSVAAELLTAKNLEWVKLPWPRKAGNFIANFCFAIFASLKLQNRRRDISLLHGNGFVSFCRMDLNTVHFVHSSWLNSPFHTLKVQPNCFGLYHWIYTWLNAKLELISFRNSKVLVAVSELVKEELLSLGLNSERIKVIPNGVDLSEYKPGPANRKELGLPESVRLALFVGEIKTPRKNLETCFRAIKQIPDFHLAVAAADFKSSIYPELAKDLGIESRVHFLGYRNDIADLMRSSDCFLFPSRYESSGLVLLEALASGLPVFTAKTVGVSDLVDKAGGCILENPDDYETLAQAVIDLFDSNKNLSRAKLFARQVAEAYGWENMVESYCKLYKEQLAQIKHEQSV
ncbi:MAG: glycosyltransferase family 4 protein [Candidatus Obscuribacterales bacterium]|nr:glycosyltransferase family 4 protein [Candidatus Obscuribacterales bacterium]